MESSHPHRDLKLFALHSHVPVFVLNTHFSKVIIYELIRKSTTFHTTQKTKSPSPLKRHHLNPHFDSILVQSDHSSPRHTAATTRHAAHHCHAAHRSYKRRHARAILERDREVGVLSAARRRPRRALVGLQALPPGRRPPPTTTPAVTSPSSMPDRFTPREKTQ